jgi:DNA-binding transcriptional LysR family regulator
MNVGLRPLRMFLAVAKHGSFSRAAEEIGSSQSAVSLAVRHVEAELGLKLLDRTTRQVRLTTAGQALAATASRLIGELDAALRELHDIGVQRRGKVMMACVPSVARSLMPICIAHCSRRWPEVSFAIDDVPAETVLEKILRGDVEFGLSSGEVGGPDLHVESLMNDRFLLVCRRENIFSRRGSVAWTDLAGQRLITPLEAGDKLLMHSAISVSDQRYFWSLLSRVQSWRWSRLD